MIPKHTKGSQVSYTVPFLLAGSHQHLADKGSDWEKSLECSSQHSVPSLQGHLAWTDGHISRLLQPSQSKEPKCPKATRGAGVDVPEGAQGEFYNPSPPQPSFLTAKPPEGSQHGEHEVPPSPVGGDRGSPRDHPGTFFSTSNFPPRGSAHPPSQPIQFFPPKCQAEEQQQSMETCLGNNYVQPEHEYSTSPRWEMKHLVFQLKEQPLRSRSGWIRRGWGWWWWWGGITWLVPCGGRRLDARQERDTAPLEQCHTHKTKTGIWMLTKISNKEIWLNKISSHIILYYILLLLSRKLYVHKNTNTQFCRTVWF